MVGGSPVFGECMLYCWRNIVKDTCATNSSYGFSHTKGVLRAFMLPTDSLPCNCNYMLVKQQYHLMNFAGSVTIQP